MLCVLLRWLHLLSVGLVRRTQMITDSPAKYLTDELTKHCPSDRLEKLAESMNYKQEIVLSADCAD